jgi:hypothetical protein
VQSEPQGEAAKPGTLTTSSGFTPVMIRWDLFLVVFGWLPIELCPLIGQVHPPYVDSVEEERLLVLPIAWFVPD